MRYIIRLIQERDYWGLFWVIFFGIVAVVGVNYFR